MKEQIMSLDENRVQFKNDMETKIDLINSKAKANAFKIGNI